MQQIANKNSIKNNQSLDWIVATLKNSLKFLKKKYNVKSLEIFGSYAKNLQNENSDLDLLVEFSDESEIGIFEFVRLENEISELLNLKIDLVIKDSIKEKLKISILSNLIPIL